VSLKGLFYCCRAVIFYMMKQYYGRIVNIAFIAGKEGNPIFGQMTQEHIDYMLSKIPEADSQKWRNLLPWSRGSLASRTLTPPGPFRPERGPSHLLARLLGRHSRMLNVNMKRAGIALDIDTSAGEAGF